MTESAMDNQTLLRRTLVTAGTMVGGAVAIVGTLTVVALAIVGHAVSPTDSAAGTDAGAAVPATGHARPGVVPIPTSAKAK
jgi:hypothetical protein